MHIYRSKSDRDSNIRTETVQYQGSGKVWAVQGSNLCHYWSIAEMQPGQMMALYLYKI